LALAGLRDTPVLLVDSGSTDHTVHIASKYSVEIYCYLGPPFSAAAGRRVGFERTHSRYVLFVDGDCCIEPGWIQYGLKALEQNRDAAVVYGHRREVFEAGTATAGMVAPSPDEYGLGGNAMYRADALRQVGGFNPYMLSDEEGELLGRLLAAGHREIVTPHLMFTHYTLPKTSLSGFFKRLRRGFTRGAGQTLRESIGQGTFLYHVRRLNRYVVMAGYLIAGAAVAVVSVVESNGIPAAAWLGCGFLAFAGLCIRRRSIRSALFIVLDWVTSAVHLPTEFLRSTPSPNDFSPTVQRLQ
jgi:glycosyltransferase involved in cell wall biosynthesis